MTSAGWFALGFVIGGAIFYCVGVLRERKGLTKYAKEQKKKKNKSKVNS